MRIYAFANQKGGVGKTTLALHMALFAQNMGFETLLVDLDQQGSSTYSLTGDPHFHQKREGTVLDLWQPDPELTIETSTILKGVDFLAASAGLDRVEDDIAAGVRALAQLRDLDYDCVVLDCPPAPGVRQIAAILNADVQVVPVTPDRFGTQGVASTIKLHAEQILPRNPNLRLHVVVNKLKANSATNKAIAAALQEKLPGVVCPEILYDREDVKRALNLGKPYWELCKDAQADVWYALYNRLAEGLTNAEDDAEEVEEPENVEELL